MPVDLQGETMRPRPFTLKGWHVLVMIVSFFVVVSGVNGIMMTLAIRTMPGLEVKNSYDASQKFNTEIAEARVVNSHGYKADLGVEAQDPIIRIYDAAGQPATALAVSAALIHPTDAGRDEALTFIETDLAFTDPLARCLRCVAHRCDSKTRF